MSIVYDVINKVDKVAGVFIDIKTTRSYFIEGCWSEKYCLCLVGDLFSWKKTVCKISKNI